MIQRSRMKRRMAIFLVALMITSLFQSFMAVAFAADDMLAWYQFDQADGGKVKDLSGKGNDATVVGSTALVDGRDGKSISLTGGYVQLPNNLLNNATAITISTWVQMDSVQSYSRIFDFGSGTTRYLFLTSTGRNDGAEGLAAAITTNGWGSEEHVTKGTDLATGVWKHVALVISGSTGTLYEDGVKVAENKELTLNPSSLGNTTANFIGKSQFSGDPTFRGKFDDFRIYNRALSGSEIMDAMGLTADEIVKSDRDSINLGNLFTVDSDITLPTQGPLGSSITWRSSNESVIDTNGKVTRPEPGQGNANVDLTATISMNGSSVTREFNVTVLALLSDTEIVSTDKENLSLGDLDEGVTSDVNLPSTGQLGSVISWQTSNASVMDASGKVTRPDNGQGDAEVTLTATLTHGQAMDTKIFHTKVIEKSFVLAIKSIEAIHVQTVAGTAPTLPDSVIGEYNDGKSSRQMKVVWDPIDSAQYTQTGDFQVEGNVQGTEIQAVAHVSVKSIMFQATWNTNRLMPGEKLQTVVEGKNTSDNAVPALVTLALYDQEGKMRQAVHDSKEVGAQSSASLTAELELPADVTGYTAKVFVWEGDDIKASSLQPLAGVVQLGHIAGPPAIPAGLAAVTEEGTSQVIVSWEETEGAESYDLEVDGVVMNHVTSPYHYSGTYNSTHSFAVRAVSKDGASAWSLSQSATIQAVPGNASWVVQPFSLKQVSLESSPFTENRDRTYSMLLFLDNDRMLYNFRAAAGLSTEGAQPLGGWDAPNSNLRGHSTGHYLSALSMAYASSGDTRFKDKLDDMITELGKVQDAMPSQGYSEGFLSGYSEDQFIKLESYASYPTIWAPYYTLHKIMAGLVDAYRYTGNEQALDIADKMGDWVYGRLSVLPKEQLKKMWSLYIAGEYGGMNDVMAELYAITGKEQHLKTAQFFDNETLFAPTADNIDTLTGKHANQHIPQITGALRVYDQTNDASYYKVAENFWHMVVDKRTFSIGGTGEGEFFKGADAIASIIDDKDAETCATYNMLKLTRNLFFHNPDPQYMDYYERALYNHILASQNQADPHGGTTYFVPLGPGNQKSYSNDYNSFTCCMGTGLENHVKYQESIYFYSTDLSTLYVNLYIPSTLHWEAKGFTIKQTTSYPNEGATSLTVDGSGQLDIKLRVPYWVEEGYTVKVNGVEQNIAAVPGTYVTISRVWSPGDKIDISMPFSLRLEKTPDDPSTGSIMYGPLLMVGKSNSTSWTNLKLNTENLSQSITPTGTLSFSTNGIPLVPMYQAYNFRYHAYFKINQ
ncbi:beta-L-arabinofuranosidase domain-containing protein [Paenibacillus hexagrammi]|uniref:Glycoside hydrolase family 127 protein n=1 Tax=Paenibacillus hexagrammi TaxID=2908839 RepID=A0ABY3SQF9_9BACL|nr:beta-L-arabinofuranosidase domain-containing protein [Paenibacillus sp. YPD9-1]UJF35484.1 glycoside hydrolase family 127 protein [Paenibacillus sp. YPD9-1]